LGQAETYWSAADIMHFTGWTLRQVRRRAQECDWGRLDVRPQKYRASDVAATYERELARHAAGEGLFTGRAIASGNLALNGGAVYPARSRRRF
jgi:hypothetical protein